MIPFKSNHFQNILFLLFILFLSSKSMEPKYNKGEVQDPDIDKKMSEAKNLNVFYFNSGSQQTLYKVELNPNATSEMSFKIYTNSEFLIDALDKGLRLYFGFDFMFENKKGGQYNSDIIICSFDTKNSNCYDYIFDVQNNKYRRNDGGRISPNFLLPFGFQNVSINILKGNVIGYKNYYCIKFNKIFSESYQDTTFLLWLNYLSKDLIHKVTGFYGITTSEDDMDEIPLQFPIYYNILDFGSGSDLKTNKNDLRHAVVFIKYLLILLVTFWL